MRPSRLPVFVAIGALAAGVEWLGAGHGGVAAADFAVGVAFLGGALAVGEREPRLAMLFLATAAAWFLGTLAGSDIGVVAGIGSVLLYAHRGPLVHLLLAYPSGRLRSPLDRLVVAFAYADGLFVAIAQDDAVTLALVAVVVAAAAFGIRRESAGVRPARALATACAALPAAALALGSALALARGTTLTATTLLLAYEAALGVAAAVLAVGILTERRGPRAVADLVVELGGAPRAGALREALARALGDPSLELVYRVGDAYVGQGGEPVALPSNGNGRAVTRFEGGGEPLAALVHDSALAGDTALTDAIAAAARLTAANARLLAQLEDQLGELAASRRRAVEVGDAQRSRLERRLSHAADLHLREMRDALSRASEVAPAAAAAALAVVETELEAAVADLRELARGIHPHSLTANGLATALAELAATAPLLVAVDVPVARFGRSVEAAAYFVCAEALANVSKHAHAKRVSVDVRRDGERVVVRVADDGIGGADGARGSGLRGLADRVEAVGGCLAVSSPAGGGTAVVAEIPLEHVA